MPYNTPVSLSVLNPPAAALVKHSTICPTSEKILSDLNFQRIKANLSSVTINPNLPLDKPYKTIRTKKLGSNKLLVFYIHNKNIKSEICVFGAKQIDYDRQLDWTPFADSLSKEVNIQVKNIGDRCNITITEGKVF